MQEYVVFPFQGGENHERDGDSSVGSDSCPGGGDPLVPPESGEERQQHLHTPAPVTERFHRPAGPKGQDTTQHTSSQGADRKGRSHFLYVECSWVFLFPTSGILVSS